MSRPGLELMRDRTPDGLCPFCLDPLPTSRRGVNFGNKTSQLRRHCGDSACQTAYMRCYQRDRRAGLLASSQRTVAR